MEKSVDLNRVGWELFASGAPSPDLSSRPEAFTEKALREKISLLGRQANWDSRLQELVLAIALLWNDRCEPAHEIAQAHEGEKDFDLLHAIFHKREGDLPNSAYWRRSGGRHLCLEPLEGEASQASELKALLAWSLHP